MGLSYSLYIGPYIQCTEIATPYEINKRACWNRQCSQAEQSVWDNEKLFCSKCGNAIENKKISKVGNQCREAWEDMVTEYKEHLYPVNSPQKSNHIIMVPNIQMKTISRSLAFNTRSDSINVEVTPQSITDELKNFKTEMNSEIAIVEKYWGKENVTIKWGIIHEIN